MHLNACTECKKALVHAQGKCKRCYQRTWSQENGEELYQKRKRIREQATLLFEKTNYQDAKEWLPIVCFTEFGAIKLGKLIKKFIHPEKILQAPEAVLRKVIGPKTAKRFVLWRSQHASAAARHAAEVMKKENILMIHKTHHLYPKNLERLHTDAPHFLFIKGNPLMVKPVAIIGTRRITPYGKSIIEQFVEPLIKTKHTIISGLAEGCDAKAHAETLQHGGRTIAILAHGVGTEDISPASNRALAQHILKTGGALISEFPPGTKYFHGSFLVRNRLVAGCSELTMIVEADGKKSGTKSTMKYASEFNLTIGAVPGSITNPLSQGPNQYIRDGAQPITSWEDIQSLLGEWTRKEERLEKALQAPPEEQAIFDALANPRTPDQLTKDTNMHISQVLRCLTELQVKQLITREGPRFRRTRLS